MTVPGVPTTYPGLVVPCYPRSLTSLSATNRLAEGNPAGTNSHTLGSVHVLYDPSIHPSIHPHGRTSGHHQAEPRRRGEEPRGVEGSGWEGSGLFGLMWAGCARAK